MFQELLKIYDFQTFWSYAHNIFYFIFVQFMQFPVLDFGLDHYVSEPFICRSTIRITCRHFKYRPLSIAVKMHTKQKVMFLRYSRKLRLSIIMFSQLHVPVLAAIISSDFCLQPMIIIIAPGSCSSVSCYYQF